MQSTDEIINKAVQAKHAVALASSSKRNAALIAIADELIEQRHSILKANEEDIANAKGTISDVMIDRLRLTEERINGMANGIREVAELPDPVNVLLKRTFRPNGLEIDKVTAPMGVIAIIYESRPNVTSDSAALSIKAGSACILRSGKEAWKSSAAIVKAMKHGLEIADIPTDAINLIEDTSRQSANELMKAHGRIDLLIPRGGAGLIRACVENATVPCIETGTGICHIYVDKEADIGKALSIVRNAKTSRPSVCNACETCLVHKDIADQFLPLLKKEIPEVELRLDKRAAEIIEGTPAGEKDFYTEYLDYILAVGIVDSPEDAISFIDKHSTHHSESIITENKDTADLFLQTIDSAAVYWNASTRFTDGGEFGLGCEMGISTQKLHARGPMGLQELCTYKYIIKGNGHIR